MKRSYSIHKIAFLSIMLALAIVLGYAESFIPSWVPGVKLGLANLVILILKFVHFDGGLRSVSSRLQFCG